MKKYYKILFSILLIFSWHFIYSQDYNYIHYTNKDGLASNTVYDVAQDDNGFIYFATDNGLSRFDGKEWKTFTVKDGLPDNEILLLFKDSKNRIWMSTFGKGLCYFQNNKIFKVKEMDSLLQKGKFIIRIIETNDGALYFQNNFSIICRNSHDVVSELSLGNFQHQQSITMAVVDNKLNFINNDSLFVVENDKIINKSRLIAQELFFENKFINNFDKQTSSSQVLSFSIESNKIRFVNTNDGVFQIDSISREANKRYMINKKVGHTMVDKEDNYWFTIMDEGVYKLTSSSVKTFTKNKHLKTINKEVFTIQKNNGVLLSGTSFGEVQILNSDNKLNYNNYQYYLSNPITESNINKVRAICNINDTNVIIGFDAFVLTLVNNKLIFNYDIHPCKSIEKIDANNVVISSGGGVYSVSSLTLKCVDTLYPQRSTYSNFFNSNYYVGTLGGLYKISTTKQQTYLGNVHPSLARRVTCIKYQNNNLVIATADSGVVIMQNDKVINTLSEANGLSSNIVKTLHINNNFLWIGTIKGVSKYNLNTNKIENKYTISDGLPSNIINAIYVDTDSTIWLGTPEGLTSFKEKDIVSKSICNLVVESIDISNKNIKNDSSNFVLKYDDNIKFQFVGISFRSGEEIVYHYKLQGLDANYNTTKERLLNYPSLPSGNYILLLYATNKFGVQSKTYTCSFTVNPPFWKTWWFYLFEVLLIIAIVWAVVYIRFKRKQKEYRRVADFKVQLANMEQQALQAQMNPHFIFNCLNSIQQFILSKENDKAFNYLLLFSNLVRNTLDNSEKQYITLDEEVEYLQQYLAMEDLRFGEQFSYTINVDKNIVRSDIKMPSMILQPFIENALRHGIRQLQNRKGILEINFVQDNSVILCTIEDNGIGRKAAQLLKSNLHITYQSKGMELTQRRINLLNSNKENKIDYEIIDLINEQDEVLGTKVIITFPIF